MPLNVDPRYAPQGPKHLAIFGGSQGVGRLALEYALMAGHQVSVLTRNAAALDFSHKNLTIIEGDATKRGDVDKTISQADAVLCALGAPALSASRVRSMGTSHIVEAMTSAGVDRLVAISLLGARESREHLPFALKYFFFPFYLRRAAKEHDAQESIIADSPLDWTVLRPPHMNDGPLTQSYAYGFGHDYNNVSLHISRADVADMMLRQVGCATFSKKTVALSDWSKGSQGAAASSDA